MTAKDSFLHLIALGDSYGMKYEFVPHAQDKKADDLFHGSHPKFTEYPTGHYTDDTQMSLANLELLMARGDKKLSPDDFAQKWLDAFKRDPHVGYSKYMYKVLSESSTVAEFNAALDPSRGTTSGGAMRAGPFGLLADVEEVKALTEMQARITHNTAAGVTSALAVALTVHFMHRGGTRAGLGDFLEKHLGRDWNSAENGYADDPNNGLKIVSQAMSAFIGAKTTSDVLLTAVNQDERSDTDTVCAIAMTLAARCREIADDLPQKLRDGLEQGAYGAEYLKAMDKKALGMFPPSDIYAPSPSAAAKNAPHP